jgi:hypothetical protein
VLDATLVFIQLAIVAAGFLLGLLAHELTHALIAAPYAQQLHLYVSGRSLAQIHVSAQFEDAHSLWARLVGIAPLVIGMSIAAGAIATDSLPAIGSLEFLILCSWWAVYTLGGALSDYIERLQDYSAPIEAENPAIPAGYYLVLKGEDVGLHYIESDV